MGMLLYVWPVVTHGCCCVACGEACTGVPCLWAACVLVGGLLSLVDLPSGGDTCDAPSFYCIVAVFFAVNTIDIFFQVITCASPAAPIVQAKASPT